MFEQKLCEIQLAFKASGFEFHLTGSRHFGNSHSQSNWNYIVETSAELISFLTDLGFQYSRVRDYYNDMSTSCIYRCQYGNEPWQVIEVQCSTDINEKIRAHKYITRFFPDGLSKDKKINSNIWEMALHRVKWLKVKVNTKNQNPDILKDKVRLLKKTWKR